MTPWPGQRPRCPLNDKALQDADLGSCARRAAGSFQHRRAGGGGGSAGTTADAIEAIAAVWLSSCADRGLRLLGPAHLHRIPAAQPNAALRERHSSGAAGRRAGRGDRAVQRHEVLVGHREPVDWRDVGDGWRLAGDLPRLPTCAAPVLRWRRRFSLSMASRRRSWPVPRHPGPHPHG